MNFDDLSKTWRNQEAAAMQPLDAEVLRRDFGAKSRKLSRALLRRDLMESGAGVLVALVFARTAWSMGKSGWPIVFAVLLVLGLVAFFVRERIRAHRARARVDAPLLEKLDADIAELNHQRSLLLNVGVWYLAPIVAAATIVVFTTMLNAPIPLVARIFTGAIMMSIIALVSWGVWVINLRAVRSSIEPRLHELEESRLNLTVKSDS